MVKEPRAYPLVIDLMKRSRLPWHWVTTVVSIVLLLFLVLVAYLDGVFTDLSHWSLWRNFLDAPALTIYILIVYPFVWRLWWQSVLSLQSLLPIDEGGSNRVGVEVPIYHRRWEWAYIVIGAVFWLTLWQPWGRSWEPGAIWLNVYDVVTQMILFGLLGWLVYSSFIGNRYLSRLSRQRLNVDIFNTQLLEPIAVSSLGLSLAFIGGISLSLVFQTQEDLLRWNNIVVWAILICFTVLLFFLSMWSTHTAMAEVKRHELQLVQQHLKATSIKLKERAVDSQLDGMEELLSTITDWVNYERRIKETPEWPFSMGIIRRLAASILVPVLIFLIKVLSRIGISF